MDLRKEFAKGIWFPLFSHIFFLPEMRRRMQKKGCHQFWGEKRENNNFCLHKSFPNGIIKAGECCFGRECCFASGENCFLVAPMYFVLENSNFPRHNCIVRFSCEFHLFLIRNPHYITNIPSSPIIHHINNFSFETFLFLLNGVGGRQVEMRFSQVDLR